MRVLLKGGMPVEKGNAAVKSGALQKTIESTMKALKPEAAYFFPDENGRRSFIMIFDIKESSQLPATVEDLTDKEAHDCGSSRTRVARTRTRSRRPRRPRRCSE